MHSRSELMHREIGDMRPDELRPSLRTIFYHHFFIFVICEKWYVINEHYAYAGILRIKIIEINFQGELNERFLHFSGWFHFLRRFRRAKSRGFLIRRMSRVTRIVKLNSHVLDVHICEIKMLCGGYETGSWTGSQWFILPLQTAKYQGHCYITSYPAGRRCNGWKIYKCAADLHVHRVACTVLSLRIRFISRRRRRGA